ncbi:MAG: M14-type cytosolic carboxypeptidase [Parvularcula sp.]|jgi:murein tripeptide amidase MpaA|nr:M14-type cytosolic carboxypeptidase [Parvularcula sp.]
MVLTVTSDFECGNIRVVDASKPDKIRLAIEPDGQADFYQWFYFRVAGEPGPRRMVIENASGSSYVSGWEDYQARASENLTDWRQVPTRFENGQLVIEHEAKSPVTYYAYFAPYTADDAMRFTAKLGARGDVEWMPLGLSLDGRPVDALRFGEPGDGKKVIWVIARQHPGESMGSWFAEGFCEELLSGGELLLKNAVVYVVPIMNPDGVARGHLRTNAAGTDLNRAWAEPSETKSPEVFAVLKAMDKTGCDLFLDAHGDEAIANNFVAGAEGIPSWTPRLAQLLDRFKNSLIEATKDFQDKEGYPMDAAGTADMRIACHAVGERFDCLSLTLEMPFKDAKTNPMPQEGWSPRRCRELARSVVGVMAGMADKLR